MVTDWIMRACLAVLKICMHIADRLCSDKVNKIYNSIQINSNFHLILISLYSWQTKRTYNTSFRPYELCMFTQYQYIYVLSLKLMEQMLLVKMSIHLILSYDIAKSTGHKNSWYICIIKVYTCTMNMDWTAGKTTEPV